MNTIIINGISAILVSMIRHVIVNFQKRLHVCVDIGGGPLSEIIVRQWSLHIIVLKEAIE